MEREKPYVEKKFVYKGHPCIVLFMPGGYRCGYAGVPKGRPIDVYSISCHGGITFTGDSVQDITDNNYWFIGFDCFHYGDGIDKESAYNYYGKENPHLLMHFGRNVWTLDDCINECKNIVDQIIDMLNESTDSE